MTSRLIRFAVVSAMALVSFTFTHSIQAQATPQSRPARQGRGMQGPRIVSPEVSKDRKLTFRFTDAKADGVRVTSSDIPDLGKGEMTKAENGTWELTVGPVPAGFGAAGQHPAGEHQQPEEQNRGTADSGPLGAGQAAARPARVGENGHHGAPAPVRSEE